MQDLKLERFELESCYAAIVIMYHEVILGEKLCLTVVTRRRLDLRWRGHNFHMLYCVEELDDDEVDDECAGRYWDHVGCSHVPPVRID